MSCQTSVRMALSDELMEVRAAGFRLLRYFSLCFDGVIPFLLEHKIDTLLIPALEAETKGENERYVTFKSEQLQAYKVQWSVYLLFLLLY